MVDVQGNTLLNVALLSLTSMVATILDPTWASNVVPLGAVRDLLGYGNPSPPYGSNLPSPLLCQPSSSFISTAEGPGTQYLRFLAFETTP